MGGGAGAGRPHNTWLQSVSSSLTKDSQGTGTPAAALELLVLCSHTSGGGGLVTFSMAQGNSKWALAWSSPSPGFTGVPGLAQLSLPSCSSGQGATG